MDFLNVRRYMSGNAEDRALYLQSLATTYEPKRRFRWLLEIPGIPAYVIKSAHRPVMVLRDGAVVWIPIEVVMYDPEKPSTSKAVVDWLVAKDKRKGSLSMLDPVGQVVERWDMEMELESVSFGELDYSQSEPVEITCLIKYSDPVLS